MSARRHPHDLYELPALDALRLRAAEIRPTGGRSAEQKARLKANGGVNDVFAFKARASIARAQARKAKRNPSPVMPVGNPDDYDDETPKRCALAECRKPLSGKRAADSRARYCSEVCKGKRASEAAAERDRRRRKKND